MVFVNSWSHLNSDVLSLILDKLTLRDAVRFGAVCPQWRTLFNLKRSSLCSSPWRYKRGIDNKALFYSIADDEHIVVKVPEPQMSSRRCIGANDGWLVTVDEECNIHLLQPLSGKQIELPPIGTLDFIEPLFDSKGHIMAYLNKLRSNGKKELISPSKLSNELCSLACVSKGQSHMTVMMTDDSGSLLFFARDSDQSWTTLERAEGDRRFRMFYNIISYKNMFLTSTVKGMTSAWVPDGHSFELYHVADTFYSYGTPEFKEFEKDNPEFLDGINLDRYKSTLFGNTYHIGVDTNLVQSDDMCEPILVLRDIMKMVRWDKHKLKWKQVKSLGDKSLFLGINQPVYCSANEFPELRKNSIYFSNKEDRIICLSDKDAHAYRSDSKWFTPKLE